MATIKISGCAVSILPRQAPAVVQVQVLQMMVPVLLIAAISWTVHASATDFQNLNNEQLFEQIQEDQITVGDDPPQDRPYYLLVLKVNEAVSRGILRQVQHSRVYERSGAITDLYRAVGYQDTFRLPSISEVKGANQYFEIHPLEEAHPAWLPHIVTDDFQENPVRNMEIDMVHIEVDQAPGEKYYLLVLKVCEAFKQGYIDRIPYSKKKEKRGINVEVYKAVANNEEILLPSVDDLDVAKDYFRIANGAKEGDSERLKHSPIENALVRPNHPHREPMLEEEPENTEEKYSEEEYKEEKKPKGRFDWFLRMFRRHR